MQLRAFLQACSTHAAANRRKLSARASTPGVAPGRRVARSCAARWRSGLALIADIQLGPRVTGCASRGSLVFDDLHQPLGV
jgi:hypothetical protein